MKMKDICIQNKHSNKMQNHKTQQFSKFFLKDLKPKKSKYINDKETFDDFRFSSSN